MPIPQNPTVEITFKGLFLILFDELKTRCQMVIPNHDGRHCLKITGTVSGKPVNLPQDFQKNLTLSVPERTGVSLYKGAQPGDHDQDFDLCADLEGPNFHGRDKPEKKHQLSIKPGTIKQSLMVNHGLLYTAEKHNVRLLRIENEVTTDTGITLDVAHKIGCNLYLQPGEKAILSLEGEPPLELLHEPGVTQRLMISTHCEPEAGPVDREHSDFIHYYKIMAHEGEPMFALVGSATNYKGMPPINTSPDNPCVPVFLSLTTITG